uniref:Uncharacterized protein n=1 Tax=Microcebus murinus TaxID=30608 RepID=A0A8C5YAZ9_MICMU
MSGSSRMGTTTSCSGSEPPASGPAKARAKMPSRSMAPPRSGKGLASTLEPPTLWDSRQLLEREARGGRRLREQRARTGQPAPPTCAFPSKARPGSLSAIAPRTSGRCRAASRNRSHSQRSKPAY